jgi:hypothetical protein
MSVSIYATCYVDGEPSLARIRRAVRDHVRGRTRFVTVRRQRTGDGDVRTTVYLLTEVSLGLMSKDTRAAVGWDLAAAMTNLVGRAAVIHVDAVMMDDVPTWSHEFSDDEREVASILPAFALNDT